MTEGLENGNTDEEWKRVDGLGEGDGVWRRGVMELGRAWGEAGAERQVMTRLPKR